MLGNDSSIEATVVVDNLAAAGGYSCLVISMPRPRSAAHL
jgi:hypothetical protein